MGGYERKTLKLKFEDPELEGLVVRMKRLPIGDLFAVTELADMGDSLAENKEAFDTLLTTLAASLISWNLQEDGVPVPTETGEPARVEVVDGKKVHVKATGLYSVDVDLVFAIINAWVEAASGVSRPLPSSPKSGPLSPEESEAMAALSESLSSSPTLA